MAGVFGFGFVSSGQEAQALRKEIRSETRQGEFRELNRFVPWTVRTLVKGAGQTVGQPSMPSGPYKAVGCVAQPQLANKHGGLM